MSGRAVLFDFDKTLADTIPLTVASYRHALTAPDRQAPTEAVIRGWIGRPLLETLETHRPGEGGLLVDRYREHNITHHDTLIAVVHGP